MPDLSPEWAQVIVSIITLLIALVGLIGGYFKLEQIHYTTNSKMDQLLVTTKTAATAEGNLQGREDARVIDADTNKKAISAIETVVSDAIAAPKEITANIIGQVAEKPGSKPKDIKGKIKGKISNVKK